MDKPTVTVSIRLPQDLKSGLEEICKKSDITLSQLIRIWAKGMIKEDKASQAKEKAKEAMATNEKKTAPAQAKKKRWP